MKMFHCNYKVIGFPIDIQISIRVGPPLEIGTSMFYIVLGMLRFWFHIIFD